MKIKMKRKEIMKVRIIIKIMKKIKIKKIMKRI